MAYGLSTADRLAVEVVAISQPRTPDWNQLPGSAIEPSGFLGPVVG